MVQVQIILLSSPVLFLEARRKLGLPRVNGSGELGADWEEASRSGLQAEGKLVELERQQDWVLDGVHDGQTHGAGLDMVQLLGQHQACEVVGQTLLADLVNQLKNCGPGKDEPKY